MPLSGAGSTLVLPLDLWAEWEDAGVPPTWWVESWLVWMRECRVSSSEREKRFSQPGKVHSKGFSPVCVRM